ncbi:hypothetical protein DXG03_003715 [Asterophora parasitica]|uniref:Dienelactone hydrolase domain-containing protein n=1 Tax=Asterophora parasitica TaxID=117018 RepID=A0A9P7GG71_9AGAR|nr:hypothetical protein DXG03_003715 [Asterophora parasitica]
MSCPDCTTGGLLPGKPTGTLSTQGAYLASGPSPGRAIILLTDGFGLPLKNSKILADDLAKELQCDVWVPDYFQGKLAMLPFERAYLHTKHLVFVGRPLLDVNALLLPDRAGVKIPALRVQAEGVFSECKGTSSFLEYEFKDYKGTAHGFAARPNLEIPEVKEAFERAFQQTVDWFAKTLPV